MKKKIIAAILATTIMLLAILNITINYKQLATRKEIIYSDKLHDSSLLIGFFSDLYFGNENDNKRLEDIVSRLYSFNPDLVLFGGDLLNSTDVTSENKSLLIEQLSTINPPYGKYAVFGDNDLLTIEMRNTVSSLLNDAGFEIIDNRSKVISMKFDERVNIVGLANEINGNRNNDAFSGIDSSSYTIVLSHCPDTFYSLKEYTFDYMLSGHSLGGKIDIPLISLLWSKEGAKHYYHGKVKDNQKTLDITNGSGTPDKPYRMNSDCEIVFYSLRGE